MTQSSDEHQRILDALDELKASFKHHREIEHLELMLKDEIIDADQGVEDTLRKVQSEAQVAREALQRQLNDVADVVLGEPSVNFDGNIVRTGGMQELVTDYHKGKLRLPASAVGGIIVAAISGLFSVIVVLIQVTGG